ncbi:MAG: hypothetical protein AAFP82_18295 [Bacteroidota bacterium]
MSKNTTIAIKLLKHLKPNKFALLQAIIPKMTEDMLWSIAEADYGHKADYCIQELKKICKNQAPPRKIEFALKEVLELTKWRDAKTDKEHWTRLFTCTNLLMMAHDTELMGENSILASLLESVLVLDERLIQSAIQLIAWRLLADEDNSDFYAEETPFFIYALLYLMLYQKQPTSKIKTLFQWLNEAEAKEREVQVWSTTFLLGITVYDQRHLVWKALTQKLIPKTEYLDDLELKEELLVVLDWILDDEEVK